MAITMKDIATKANVSVYTVSRALNNGYDIKQETKERILKIADELGYVTNIVAKSLVTKKTKTIGILNSRNINPFYIETYEAISEVCFEHGYSIFFCNTGDSADRELEYLKEMKSRSVDGILIFPIQKDNRYIEFLNGCLIPYVFLTRHPDTLSCDYVKNDNEYGGYIAINHLIQRGYRNINYLCANANTTTGQGRIAGSKRALIENGLPPESLKIISCDETIDASYQCTKELLIEQNMPDAIFIWNDKLVLGVMNAIFERGLKIPDDIAIMGYDDLEISKYLSPPLTTIAQDSRRIGEIAAHILIEKIESEAKHNQINQIILKPALVVRQST